MPFVLSARLLPAPERHMRGFVIVGVALLAPYVLDAYLFDGQIFGVLSQIASEVYDQIS
jgi:hypothetical protein